MPPLWVFMLIAGGASLLFILTPFAIARHLNRRQLQLAGTPAARREPGQRPAAPPRAEASPKPATLPAAPPVAATPAELALTWPAALEYLNRAVHVLLVAQSTAGKSTLAMALAHARAQTDQLIIFNPHRRPGDYGDLPQLRTYEEINTGMLALLNEFESRKERAARGDTSYPPLTIIVEEAPDVMSRIAPPDGGPTTPKVPAARRFVGEQLRQGAKYGMRLVILTQTTQVKPLGIEGESEVLNNLVWMVLGDMAIDEHPGAAEQERPAVLVHRRRALLADVRGAGAAARQALDPAVVYALTVSPGETAGEKAVKPFHPGETHVSPIATGRNDDDISFPGVNFTVLARLVRAGPLGETKALEVACGVSPGKSERYKVARQNLKDALDQLDQAAST